MDGDQQQSDHADGKVYVKDPRPREIGDDEAAHRGAEQRRQRAGDGDVVHRLDEVALGRALDHDHASHRRHHGAADALHRARDHQRQQGIGKSAQNRTRGEDDDRQHVDTLGAVTIGHPATYRHENRQGQKVAGDGEIEGERILAQGFGHRGQRGRNRRPIELMHELCASDDDGDDERKARGHDDFLVVQCPGRGSAGGPPDLRAYRRLDPARWQHVLRRFLPTRFLGAAREGRRAV